MKTVDKLTGVEAAHQAKLKSRYGRRDWVHYTTREGERIAEVLTADSLKRAMLAKGTQGKFTQYSGGHGFVTTWGIGLNILRQLRNNWC